MPDHIIYEIINGKITKTGKPNHPDKPNFLIRYKLMDWSGFRYLSECVSQLDDLNFYRQDQAEHFSIVER